MTFCALCGMKFIPDNEHPYQKFCCTKHRQQFGHKKERGPDGSRTQKEREAREKIVCGICGMKFTPTIHHQKYCDKEDLQKTKEATHIRWHPRAMPSTRICKRCGEEFEAIGNKKYCHKHCSDSTQSQKRRQKMHKVIHIPYSKRDIFQRDDFICYLCETPVDMDAHWPMPYSPSIDHVIPIKSGGADAPYNVKAAHLVCNQNKAAKLLQ